MRLFLIAAVSLLLLVPISCLQCKDGEDYLRMVKKSRMNGYNDMFTIKDNSPFSELFVSPLLLHFMFAMYRSLCIWEQREVNNAKARSASI